MKCIPPPLSNGKWHHRIISHHCIPIPKHLPSARPCDPLSPMRPVPRIQQSGPLPLSRERPQHDSKFYKRRSPPRFKWQPLPTTAAHHHARAFVHLAFHRIIGLSDGEGCIQVPCAAPTAPLPHSTAWQPLPTTAAHHHASTRDGASIRTHCLSSNHHSGQRAAGEAARPTAGAGPAAAPRRAGKSCPCFRCRGACCCWCHQQPSLPLPSAAPAST